MEASAEFNLVVPLHSASGADLSADTIRLFDQSGRLIYGAAVRGGEVVPILVEQLE